MQQINKDNFVSNIINITAIAKLLGIKINESFKIQFYNHKQPLKYLWYKLTDNGLMCSYLEDEDYHKKSNALEGLLLGKHQIVKEHTTHEEKTSSRQILQR